ncbi:hypothetical protein SAMCCGM7_pC0168 (plasmid) [Sinorhizobium americanum CCGM7]|uniref:hypothetical protein n=1 Tax=Sinorhizobium americanum TaxID=194963 RepID=UPI0004D7EDD7|nr:hypothetical protein [Sinorhizobium americanum]APG87373.1 hypothetical protein SAMCCGM7_pC0168 [Sinorhizobium americanum CCGM7]
MIRNSFIATAPIALAGIAAAAPIRPTCAHRAIWLAEFGRRRTERLQNRIRVYQNGRFNTVIGQQNGRRNVTAIGQEGNRNHGATYQTGKRNAADIGQSGSGGAPASVSRERAMPLPLARTVAAISASSNKEVKGIPPS